MQQQTKIKQNKKSKQELLKETFQKHILDVSSNDSSNKSFIILMECLAMGFIFSYYISCKYLFFFCLTHASWKLHKKGQKEMRSPDMPSFQQTNKRN